jgi:hypothetical protein
MRPRAAMIAVAIALLGTTAWAGGFSKLRGKIIVSDDELPAMDDEEKATAALAKADKSTLERSKSSSSWSFHIVAFPKAKPGAKTLSLLFYDVTDKRKYLTSKEITIGDAGAMVVVTDVDVAEDDGIVPGHKIEINLAKMSGDKETDLATAKVTFTKK